MPVLCEDLYGTPHQRASVPSEFARAGVIDQDGVFVEGYGVLQDKVKL
jgi:hypothetical protein